MKVNDDTIKELIEGTKQFEVPIWQRQYTWTAREQDQLWKDLREQYDGLVAGSAGSHFVGTFVLSPHDPSATGVTHFLVVDGQQRLTTLMLLLCAIRDVAAAGDPQAVERYNGLYLINQYAEGEDRYRLLPTEADREAFLRWVDRAEDNGSGDAISAAYRRLRRHVEALLASDGSDSTLARLTTAVVERLEFVEITTHPSDNVHRIFQSLNGTGAPLHQADLLRNHIFMLLPNRGTQVYQEVWQPMEQLIGVENLQGLARVDLLRRGEDIPRERVYEAHQRLLTPIASNEAEVEERVRDLAYRASLYKKLIDPGSEAHPATAEGLGRLARWGAQTSHPLLMMALDLRHRQILTDSHLAEAVSLVESFLVRRQLARIPTNALNRIFVQLVPRMPEDGTFVEALHRELSRDRLYWPNDQEISEALRKQPFFHIGRSNQRKMILERLERSFGHPEKVDFEESDLSVEHILPQTLSAEWRTHLEELGQDPTEVHAELVHTLGNLTLTAFNGQLSNNPFERKSQIYEASHLELNRALAENEVWGRDQILARATVLAERVTEIWPSPLPETPSEPEAGFDWGQIDTAIGVIPAGRWTSYGDLAELGGTAAVPVGGHVMQLPSGTNAYRVLTSSGHVSSNFSWRDPSDQRDPQTVLEAEGVVFGADGAASQDQRMTAESLNSLIDSISGTGEDAE